MRGLPIAKFASIYLMMPDQKTYMVSDICLVSSKGYHSRHLSYFYLISLTYFYFYFCFSFFTTGMTMNPSFPAKLRYLYLLLLAGIIYPLEALFFSKMLKSLCFMKTALVSSKLGRINRNYLIKSSISSSFLFISKKLKTSS